MITTIFEFCIPIIETYIANVQNIEEDEEYLLTGEDSGKEPTERVDLGGTIDFIDVEGMGKISIITYYAISLLWEMFKHGIYYRIIF